MARKHPVPKKSNSRHQHSKQDSQAEERPTKPSKKVLLWIGGVLATAVAAALTVVLLNIPKMFIDIPHLEDEVKPGPDIRTNVSKVMLDGGSTKVVRGDFDIDPESKRLLAEPGGLSNTSLPEDVYGPGVDFTKMEIKLVMENTRAQRIRIVEVAPEILERDEPLQGTFFDIPGQAAEDDARSKLDFDRVKPILKTLPKEGSSKKEEPYFSAKTISLKENEQQTLLIRALSTKYHVSFRIKINYLIGGEPRSQIVDDEGKAFEIAGIRCGNKPRTLSYKRIYSITEDWALREYPNPNEYPIPDGTACN